jgi:predicted nucleic acid-binding protein
MTGTAFVDTNVLVYARDADAGDKQVRAMEWLAILWRDRNGRLSYQVLQEYYVTVTQKLRPGLPIVDARRDVTAFFAWNPIVSNDVVMRRGWELQDQFGLSWWDCLIAAAALELGCAYLISEDFQHPFSIDDLTIVNPFQATPADLA